MSDRDYRERERTGQLTADDKIRLGLLTLMDPKERLVGYDWESVFNYGGPTAEKVGSPMERVPGFEMDDVVGVLAADDGMNDESNWLAVVLLKDGRWGFIYAGCDYTGWG